MNEKMKNILVGLFTTSAVTIAIAMILFLEPKIGDGKKTLRVRFANISGIVVGTRVAFAGKPVGEVLHIREIPDARQYPDSLGRVYFYELTLKTDSSVEVYDTDEIALRSLGLMGEKSIAILPKAGASPTLITHQIIYANSVDPLENTFTQMTKVANRIEEAAGHLDSWFLVNRDALTDVVKTAHGAMSGLEDSLRKIASGQGTIGRLVARDDFYLHLSSILSKAETLMNDINHYGILFQYDKHWQRSRMKRANILKSLETPQEFRCYFEQEIDSITTSLGRIASLMEKVNETEESRLLFKKEFASLLKNVQSLTDSIKLYNEELSPK